MAVSTTALAQPAAPALSPASQHIIRTLLVPDGPDRDRAIEAIAQLPSSPDMIAAFDHILAVSMHSEAGEIVARVLVLRARAGAEEPALRRLTALVAPSIAGGRAWSPAKSAAESLAREALPQFGHDAVRALIDDLAGWSEPIHDLQMMELRELAIGTGFPLRMHHVARLRTSASNFPQIGNPLPALAWPERAEHYRLLAAERGFSAACSSINSPRHTVRLNGRRLSYPGALLWPPSQRAAHPHAYAQWLLFLRQQSRPDALSPSLESLALLHAHEPLSPEQQRDLLTELYERPAGVRGAHLAALVVLATDRADVHARIMQALQQGAALPSSALHLLEPAAWSHGLIQAAVAAVGGSSNTPDDESQLSHHNFLPADAADALGLHLLSNDRALARGALLCLQPRHLKHAGVQASLRSLLTQTRRPDLAAHAARLLLIQPDQPDPARTLSTLTYLLSRADRARADQPLHVRALRLAAPELAEARHALRPVLADPAHPLHAEVHELANRPAPVDDVNRLIHLLNADAAREAAWKRVQRGRDDAHRGEGLQNQQRDCAEAIKRLRGYALNDELRRRLIAILCHPAVNTLKPDPSDLYANNPANRLSDAEHSLVYFIGSERDIALEAARTLHADLSLDPARTQAAVEQLKDSPFGSLLLARAFIDARYAGGVEHNERQGDQGAPRPPRDLLQQALPALLIQARVQVTTMAWYDIRSIQLLGELGTPEAVDALLHVVRARAGRTTEALVALARAAPDHPELLPLLARQIRQGNQRERERAFVALKIAGRHGEPLITRLCIEALASPMPYVHRRLSSNLARADIRTHMTALLRLAEEDP